MDKGIKELVELVEGIKQVALVGKAVLKDGKVDLSDLAALSVLLAKQQDLMAAFEGVSEIPEEIKDMDLDEASAVVLALVAAAKEIKAA